MSTDVAQTVMIRHKRTQDNDTISSFDMNPEPGVEEIKQPPGKTFLSAFGLHEPPPPGPDGTWGGLISPPEQSRVIFTVAWSSLFGALTAWHKGHTDLIFVPGGIWATSLLFWWHPTYSWRRSLDMTVIQTGLWYQVVRAANAEYAFAYYVITGAAVSCYGLGWLFYLRRQTWAGTLCHAMVHVLGNIANVILYNGYVPPLGLSGCKETKECNP
jgi:hypothetical protein